MTREEAIKEIKNMAKFNYTLAPTEVFDMAIKALEQEPCEDAVSRQTVSYIIKSHIHEIITESGTDKNAHTNAVLRAIVNLVETMPSVTPTACIAKVTFDKDELQKIVDEGVKDLTITQKWIPVSDRLPEEHLCDDGYVEPSDYVLVCGDCGNYGLSRYWGNRRSKSESPNTYKDWVDLDWVAQKPIAWMPLPEPYKAEME